MEIKCIISVGLQEYVYFFLESFYLICYLFVFAMLPQFIRQRSYFCHVATLLLQRTKKNHTAVRVLFDPGNTLACDSEDFGIFGLKKMLGLVVSMI